MEKYYVNYADGRQETILRKRPLPLNALQKLVGGYIEFSALDGKRTACVNEDGLILELKINPSYPQYVGNVVIGSMKFDDELGEVFGGVLK